MAMDGGSNSNTMSAIESDSTVLCRDLSVLLKQLDDCLASNDIKLMKFLCHDLVPRARLESVTRGIHLFNELRRKELLAPNNVLLGQLFFKMGRYDLLRQIRLTKNQVCQSMSNSVIPPFRFILHGLCEQMTNHDVDEVKWFCREVGNISRIHMDSANSSQEVFLLLEDAGVIAPDNLSVLQDIFRRMSRPDLCSIISNVGRTANQSAGVQRRYVGSSDCSITSNESANMHVSDLRLHAPTPSVVSQRPSRNPGLARYRMKAKPLGVCLIINIKDYTHDPNNPKSRKMDKRRGTDRDCELLVETFRNLNFITKVKENLTDIDLRRECIRYSQKLDHRPYDCFVCCILSHGSEGRVYGSNGVSVRVLDLVDNFKANKAPTLADKPKLFFINACQGKEQQPAVYLEHDGPHRPRQQAEKMEVDTPADNAESIPIGADILIGYAASPGTIAFRNPQTGTWYVNVLCKVLNDYAHREDLLSMLTLVNEKIGQSIATWDDQPLASKQCPAPFYTLRKKVFFIEPADY